ncbi:ATPase [Colletotrichum higginsianum IMI 349063]|uniref:ATPase n=2 Tax=Colletotrichum higginsianum (strain IMI 349063) TaxID=759273 RepID=A0A1B7Y312_COLHI|nr:ATPase [Colletotrichum higginsianum IMI 349063]OBR06355.1 ATPase [Colletotrichum higginsianum IMI 349063]GJD04241.1 ATPase [Colletotrichum higginsianum]
MPHPPMPRHDIWSPDAFRNPAFVPPSAAASLPRRTHPHISAPPPPPPPPPSRLTPHKSEPGNGGGGGGDGVTKEFFKHSSAKRVNTDAVITKALKEQYPHLELVVVPEMLGYGNDCNLLGFAQAGNATFEPVEDVGGALPSSLEWLVYLPPARRLDGDRGGLANAPIYGKYLYKWQGHEFIVYLVDGRDGTGAYPPIKNYYVLAADSYYADQLVLAAGKWSSDLHEEVWVYDEGYWQKSRELFESIRNASWDSVILDEDMKQALVEDHLSFFNSRDTYQNLRVPWKRGLIYYGPPGNGKTISIKATMNMLYGRGIPTLYVRTLVSYMGPEYSIKQIFGKAREYAPCYLVLEDLDTIISEGVRSYFLNEMDGLKSNDGIFIIGSTNHLDRLDPGIAKRPSRFDRKYLFPDPNLEQRVAYCHFWQKKLRSNKDIEFPDKLCDAVAGITDKFSFAYIQEAFVAALLAIARQSDGSSGGKKRESARPALTEQLDDDWLGVVDASGDEDLKKLVLWVEIKKQIEILREGMEQETATSA